MSFTLQTLNTLCITFTFGEKVASVEDVLVLYKHFGWKPFQIHTEGYYYFWWDEGPIWQFVIMKTTLIGRDVCGCNPERPKSLSASAFQGLFPHQLSRRSDVVGEQSNIQILVSLPVTYGPTCTFRKTKTLGEQHLQFPDVHARTPWCRTVLAVQKLDWIDLSLWLHLTVLAKSTRVLFETIITVLQPVAAMVCALWLRRML